MSAVLVAVVVVMLRELVLPVVHHWPIMRLFTAREREPRQELLMHSPLVRSFPVFSIHQVDQHLHLLHQLPIQPELFTIYVVQAVVVAVMLRVLVRLAVLN